MSINDTLSKIPVVSQPRPRDGLAWKRKTFQAGMIITLLLIPLLGIFRIDLSSGFIVFGRQIWFADFSIVFGFWLAVACTFILLYSTVGTAFCGWACPQNTFSSMADRLTSKLLGKRAVIDWEKSGSSKIATHKNKILNWVVLSFSILLIAMVVALIPLLYFIEPKDAWDFFSFNSNTDNAYSIRWIYTVFVFIAFVNFAVVRHFACRYMCIYRMWQYLFKTKQTLHIDYDESRASDCEKCNYCVTQCMVDIDPRRTNTFDSCTNCGACITACNTIHSKKNVSGLLRFKLGERRAKFQSNALQTLASFRERAGWVLPVWFAGIVILVWGLATYNEFHIAAYKSETSQGSQISEYRVHLANKLNHEGKVTLSIDGLDPNLYEISNAEIVLNPRGRFDSIVKISGDLPPGIYRFAVKAQSENGWEGVVNLQHVVIRG